MVVLSGYFSAITYRPDEWPEPNISDRVDSLHLPICLGFVLDTEMGTYV